MKDSYSEGVANHTDRESCILVRKGRGEALTGGRAAQVWSREIEPPSASDGHFGVPTLLNQAEGKTGVDSLTGTNNYPIIRASSWA